MADPMEDLIMQAMAGGRAADDAVHKASLLHAVQRQIMCEVTGQVLDVRTAVLVETTGQNYVMSGDGWDKLETKFREGLARMGSEITDVIDGRK